MNTDETRCRCGEDTKDTGSDKRRVEVLRHADDCRDQAQRDSLVHGLRRHQEAVGQWLEQDAE